MTRRRLITVAVAVAVLMVSAVTVAYAAGDKFVAKFEATAGIGAVGPAHLIGGAIGDPFLSSMQATTDIKVNSNSHGVVKKITVTTVNEAVLNGAAPLIDGNGDPVLDGNGDPIIVGDTLVGGCVSPQNTSAACDAVRTLLNGSGILSLHTSTARLTKIDEGIIPLFLLPTNPTAVALLARWDALGLSHDGILRAYSGKLRGNLQGAFLVQSPTSPLPLEGAVGLRIKGTATYQCFEPDGFSPLPGAAYCENGTPENTQYVGLSLGDPLFLPSTLSVVDKGRFLIDPAPETVTVGDLWLKKMTGKLKVTVNGLGGVVQSGSGIELTKGKAVFKTFAPVSSDVGDDGGHHNGHGEGHEGHHGDDD